MSVSAVSLYRVLLCRVLLAGLLGLLAFPAIAQPALHIKRTRVAWPKVEVYFSVGCNGAPFQGIQRGNLRLWDDGKAVADFELWCPDPSSRCPISAALVFDASDTMQGAGNAGARAAGHAFINAMDGAGDEATVVYFNTTVTVPQHMTTVPALLHAAVDAIPSVGATAVWDGIFIGLILISTVAQNQCRAVIVLSDGDDNSSSHTMEDVIQLAVQHNIRVFTVGYGDAIKPEKLQRIADVTGGAYYHTPDPSRLRDIYTEISEIMFEHFQECRVDYEPGCADGAAHEVTVDMLNVCDGNDSKRKSYIAPFDSTNFLPLPMQLGEANVPGGATARVPLRLASPLPGELLYPFSVEIEFNTLLLELREVQAPPGSALEGVDFSIAPTDKGAVLRSSASRVLTASPLLCELHFSTASTENALELPLLVRASTVLKGCRRPVVENGVVRLTRSAPLMRCAVTAPAEIRWNSTEHHYEPDPVSLRLALRNDGVLPARDARVRVEFDSGAVQLVAPHSRTITAEPASISAGEAREFTWLLSALPAREDDTLRIQVVAEFSNHPPIVCEHLLFVGKAGLRLRCAVLPPLLSYAPGERRYLPDPALVAVTVANVGSIPSGVLAVRLTRPAGFVFADGAEAEKNIVLEKLDPGRSVDAYWSLVPQLLLGGERLPLHVQLLNDGRPYAQCVSELPVPTRPVDFTTQVTISGAAAFCEGDSVVLDAGDGFAAYLWNNGVRDRRCVVRQAGTYSVRVMDFSGRIGESAPVNVEVYPRPAPPVILRMRDTLLVTPHASQQWYRYGVPIDSATGARLALQRTGRYYVRVTSEHGCENVSDEFEVLLLDNETAMLPDAWSLRVYPDPVRSELTIHCALPAGTRATARIVSLLGREVWRAQLTITGSAAITRLDVRTLAPGVYVLHVQDGERMVSRRFVRE